MTVQKQLLKYIAFGSTGIIILILTTATIIEKYHGITFTYDCIYASIPMIILWCISAVSALLYTIKCRIWKQRMTFCIHLAFILVLIGALTTHIFGIQGRVHLRQDNHAENTFNLSDGTEAVFPFEISLKSFSLEYYEGTSAPMDYVSTIIISENNGETVEGKVSINNIFEYRNYRFYQSGYDKDGFGTTLSVSYDPFGIAITYTGYLSLIICMIGFFFQKSSTFRSLLKHPSLFRSIIVILVTGCSSLSLSATELPQTLSQQTAEKFGNLYVYYNNRICPLQTLAKEFTVKLYGKSTYKGLSAEQVLTGWFFYYDEWKTEPMIKIKGKEVKSLLGIDGKYACLKDFLDVNGYKLELALQNSETLQSRQNIENTNEKFNLISMLCTGGLLKIYPYRNRQNGGLSWYSLTDKLPEEMLVEQWSFIRNSMNYIAEKVALGNSEDVESLLLKIREYQIKEGGKAIPSESRFAAEKIYNTYNYNKNVAILCLTIGILSFIILCLKSAITEKSRKIWRIALTYLIVVIFAYLTMHISLRGYISNHIPLSNGFETMQFMAWHCLLLTLFVRRKFYMSLPFGFLLCGLTLLVSMLGESAPQITQLMPVLQSPLLSIHVVSIMIAYSLLAFTMLNGVTAVILQHTQKESANEVEYLQVISRLILYPAVFLLVIGIFVGAVWANISWGRYWGWDPKEVWALITMLVYSSILHTSSLTKFSSPIFFHLFCIFAFFTVLITYFGVNFFLGGMHSYAN